MVPRSTRAIHSAAPVPKVVASCGTTTTTASLCEPFSNPIEESTAGHDPASPPSTAYENDAPVISGAASNRSHTLRLLTPDSCLLTPSSLLRKRIPDPHPHVV